MRFARSLLLASVLTGISAAPAAANCRGESPEGGGGGQGAKGCPMCKMMGKGGHGGMKGHGGMMGHGHMMGHGGARKYGLGPFSLQVEGIAGHYWRGPEVIYHTGMDLAGATNPVGQYLDVGMNRRFEFNDFLALGFTHRLAYQLNPATGQGSWLVPYGGIVPRVGLTLGPARLDVGATAGLGGMVRTGAADTLQARLMWLLEPNAELSFRMAHMSLGLRAGYMMTPNPGDFGGLNAGLRVGFGGFHSAKGGRDAGPTQDQGQGEGHEHGDQPGGDADEDED